MKKVLVVLVAVFGFSTMQAQMDVGAGVSIGGGTAIEAKANFAVSDQISISPSVDYYLIDSAYSYTMFGINVDGHYNFEVGDGFVAYPLVGLNYLMISGDGFTFASGVGINVGGGATYEISDSMKLYGELKYRRYGSGLSVGVMFSL
jgi:outer membrane scaffolding protein for murein synthesis (MipA/OmpV family)